MDIYIYAEKNPPLNNLKMTELKLGDFVSKSLHSFNASYARGERFGE